MFWLPEMHLKGADTETLGSSVFEHDLSQAGTVPGCAVADGGDGCTEISHSFSWKLRQEFDYFFYPFDNQTIEIDFRVEEVPLARAL